MNGISYNNSDKAKIALGTAVGSTALLSIPYISEIADVVYPAISTKKLEKVPFKDAFVRSVENQGALIKNHFKIFSKYSNKRVGAIHTALWSAFDIFLATSISYGLSKKLVSKKYSQNK